MQFIVIFANKAGINQLETTTVDDLDELHRLDQNRTYNLSVLRRCSLCMCAVRCPPRQESLQCYDWLLLSHQTSFT